MARVTSSYLICATPRTGSTLLCRALRDAGAGNPREYFNWLQKPIAMKRWRAKDDRAYYRCLMREAGRSGEIFASKVMWAELSDLDAVVRASMGDGDEDAAARFARAFPGLQYIWIRRRDKARQALSQWRARETGVWSWSGEEIPEGSIGLDVVQVARWEYNMAREDAEWGAWFERHQIVPHEVWYEDLSVDYADTVNAVLSFLGQQEAAVSEPSMRRQSDRGSEEMLAVYLRDKPLFDETTACPDCGYQHASSGRSSSATLLPLRTV